MLLCVAIGTASRWAAAGEVLPHAKTPFNGRIGVHVEDSTPSWPQSLKAPQGAPNIVIILLDDIGFADTATFGGIAQTPALDQFSRQGLRYNNFNTTAMCSPTRVALLTGRNHHRVGFGSIANLPAGYPGYDSIWKKSTASIAEILRLNGYSTAAFGKWHNTPDWEISPAGPFDHWPTGLGFEHFYGFMAARENQWEPASLHRDVTPVPAPASPLQGYHLTTDITDEAIGWLKTHRSLAPQKPYFLYFATGAVHCPHQAPKEWIDRYRGQFERGWDALHQDIFKRQREKRVIPANARLTPRPLEIPAWDSLTADQRRFYARQMEVYAGFVSHTDHEVGRLLEAIEQGPDAENTLIVYIVGDNGSEGDIPQEGITDGLTTMSEKLKHLNELGSPEVAMNSYALGWAWLGSTPFQYWKVIASHFGGVRDPMIVVWPRRIKDRGALRSQFTHVTDVAATLYDAAGIRFPKVVDGVRQQPLDGVSFAQTFDRADAPSRHRVQYFEMLGNRAIYEDGWVAAARHAKPKDSVLGGPEAASFATDRWELYEVDQDFSESDDLARRYPDKLKKLKKLFDAEARKNGVYPLGAPLALASRKDEPDLNQLRHEIVYDPSVPRLQDHAAPPLAGKSYRLTAQVQIPSEGAQGMLLTYGGRASGFSWYVQDDRLVYESNVRNGLREFIRSDLPLPRGPATLEFDFVQKGIKEAPEQIATRWGVGRLFINGRQVGEGMLREALDYTAPAPFGVGRVYGSAPSDSIQPPFAFTGRLHQVRVRWIDH